MQNAITVKEIKQIPTAKLIPNDRNRGVSNTLKNNLQKSMNTYGFRPEMPIWIDKDLNIIDGHNRYAAAIQLGISKVPVIVIDQALTFSQIVKITGTRKAWSALDWCNFYKKDNPSYAMLGHYSEEFGISVNSTARIIGTNQGAARRISEGDFSKAPDNLFDLKVTVYRALLKMKGLSSDVIKNSRFVDAFCNIMPYVDKTRFLSKMEDALKIAPLELKNTAKANIEMMNLIYNSGVKMDKYVDLVKLTKKAKGAKK